MKRFIFLFVLICVSKTGLAAEGAAVCVESDDSISIQARYDLKEGTYSAVPGDYFCSRYTVSNAVHDSCGCRNIKSFTLSCATDASEKDRYEFHCVGDTCTTKNGARKIVISAACSDWARYQSNGRTTELTFIH